MFKAKRLFAAMLVVIMAVSMMTFSAFAADTLVFSQDYTAPEVEEGSAVVKSSAVLITSKANGKAKNTEITADWDGEDYIFVVGVNAFAPKDFKAAQSQADVLAEGGLPQLLLEPGTYPELNITGSVQIFGYHWNTNPNVKSNDPTKVWTLNDAWKKNVTYVNDVVIRESASGVIDIYGIQIIHRFYDCYRPISAIKTTLTLRNVHFYQTDKTTTVLGAGANGRVLTKCAMTFWNYNAANTGVSAAQNTDETHLVNFRLGKLDMDSGGDNRFIDEIVTPNIFFDGFCADYKNTGFNCGQMFWMKWRDAMPNTKCVVENSYFTAGHKNDNHDFDFEGFYSNKASDPNKGESAELIFNNNIFCDIHMGNGYANIRIYQSEYTLLKFTNNLFINTKGGSPDLFRWNSLSGGDVSETMAFIDNDFLGYSPLVFAFGAEGSQIDVTGTHVQANYTADYKSIMSDVLPTGNIRYEYCFLDGARTISTKVLQPFTMEEGVVVDEENLKMTVTAEDGFYYKTPKATSGLGEYEIYESDQAFSNYYDFSESVKVKNCMLKDFENYFLFVWYSPDKSNFKVYRLTIKRPQPQVLALTGIEADPGATIDGVTVYANLNKDSESFTFTPQSEEGATFKLNDLKTGFSIDPTEEGGSTFSIKGLERGVTHEYRLEVAKGFDRQYYTLVVTRPYNTTASLISIDDRFGKNGNVFTAIKEKNATSYTFDIEVSEDATAIAWAGTMAFPMVDGKITITDFSTNEFALAVVAEDGVHLVKYTLKFNNVKSSQKAITSVKGATKTDVGFTAKAADKFTVSATVSAGATYVVYSDAACTKKLEGNVVPAGTTGYIVVTAEDGSAAPAVKIVVEKTTAAPEKDEIKDTSKVFTDVKNKWYKTAVDYTYSKGFISGTSATEFGVNTTVTRGMFITVLARIAGVNTTGAANKIDTKFDDVKSGKYYTAAIKWASDNKIVGGLTDTTFAPDAAIERQQLCVMIVNFAKYMKIDLKAAKAEIAFKDASSIMKYAKAAVKTCQMAEIVNGYQISGGYEFRPSNTATRAEAAQILYKFHSEFMK